MTLDRKCVDLVYRRRQLTDLTVVLRHVEMRTFYDTPSAPSAEQRTSALRELQVLLPILKPVSRRWLAEHAQISNCSGMIRAILSGRKQPGTALAKRLTEIAHAIRQANGDLMQVATLLRSTGGPAL